MLKKIIFLLALNLQFLSFAQEFNSLQHCTEPFVDLNKDLNKMFAEGSLRQMMCLRDIELPKNFAIHVVDDGWFDELKAQRLSKQTLTDLNPLNILLELDQSPFSSLAEELITQTIAYYDTHEKKIFLRGHIEKNNPDLFYQSLYHELVHVLQKQSMEEGLWHIFTQPGLGLKIFHDHWGRDGLLALLSLSEGDAEFSTALAFSLPDPFIQTLLPNFQKTSLNQYLKAEENKSKHKKIPYWVNSKLFPYIKGTRFVQKLWESADNTWEQINRAYAIPPISTEMILHPKNYIEDNKNIIPINIELDPILNALQFPKTSFTALNQQTAGELGLIQRLVINNDLPFATIENAAAGWGGDLEILFERKTYFTSSHLLTATQDTFLLSKTVWDTQEDALEFFQAWQSRKSIYQQASFYKPAEKAVYVLISQDISKMELVTIGQKL